MRRPAADGQRPSQPLRCAGLEQLPRLARLECSRSLPASAWLQYLSAAFSIAPPASLIAATGLRQLVFMDQCAFPAHTFPTQLCALGCLTGLVVDSCELGYLPEQFSNLR